MKVEKIKNLSLKTKLYTSLALVVVIIGLIGSFAIYSVNANILRQNNIENAETLSITINKNMEDTLTIMNNSTKNLQISKDVLEIYSNIEEEQNKNYFDYNIDDYNTIFDEIFESFYDLDIDGRISIISNYGDYVSIDNNTNDSVLSTNDIIQSEEYRLSKLSSAYYQIVPPHDSIFDEGEELFISIIRPLREGFNSYGYIDYKMPMTKVNDIIRLVSPKKNINFAILSSENEILYQNNDLNSKLWLENKLINQGNTSYSKENFDVIINELSHTDFKTVIINQNDILLSELTNLKRIITLYTCAILITVLSFLYFIIYKLTSPLKGLVNQLNDFDIDDTLHLPTEHNFDEINALNEAIKILVEKLNTQKNTMILLKERELSATLSSMEAQLNSHFLYNTLAVIGAYSQLEGSQTTPILCNQLSKLLRYTVNNNFKTVTFSDEIENIKAYLYRMQIRLGDKLKVFYDIDQGLNDIKVSKLIFQSIVENCFKHGFSDDIDNPEIHIKAYFLNDNWQISISNNGKIFKEQDILKISYKFNEIKSKLKSSGVKPKESSESLGLSNTVLRLNLFYEGKEYFNIKSTEQLTIIELGEPIEN